MCVVVVLWVRCVCACVRVCFTTVRFSEQETLREVQGG